MVCKFDCACGTPRSDGALAGSVSFFTHLQSFHDFGTISYGAWGRRLVCLLCYPTQFTVPIIFQLTAVEALKHVCCLSKFNHFLYDSFSLVGAILVLSKALRKFWSRPVHTIWSSFASGRSHPFSVSLGPVVLISKNAYRLHPLSTSALLQLLHTWNISRLILGIIVAVIMLPLTQVSVCVLPRAFPAAGR